MPVEEHIHLSCFICTWKYNTSTTSMRIYPPLTWASEAQNNCNIVGRSWNASRGNRLVTSTTFTSDHLLQWLLHSCPQWPVPVVCALYAHFKVLPGHKRNSQNEYLIRTPSVTQAKANMITEMDNKESSVAWIPDMQAMFDNIWRCCTLCNIQSAFYHLWIHNIRIRRLLAPSHLKSIHWRHNYQQEF